MVEPHAVLEIADGVLDPVLCIVLLVIFDGKFVEEGLDDLCALGAGGPTSDLTVVKMVNISRNGPSTTSVDTD